MSPQGVLVVLVVLVLLATLPIAGKRAKAAPCFVGQERRMHRTGTNQKLRGSMNPAARRACGAPAEVPGHGGDFTHRATDTVDSDRPRHRVHRRHSPQVRHSVHVVSGAKLLSTHLPG